MPANTASVQCSGSADGGSNSGYSNVNSYRRFLRLLEKLTDASHLLTS